MAPSTFTVLGAVMTALATVSASPLEVLAERAASYSGKMTWIGPTTGAYSACGSEYAADSMYVAVSPGLLQCSGTGGTPMTVNCNGKTIEATAIDKCMGCDPDHIDVATSVYEACGFNTGDGGMQMNGISWSF